VRHGLACPAAVYACWDIGRKWIERHVELDGGGLRVWDSPTWGEMCEIFNMARQVTRVALRMQGEVVG
jgi:hypothetical protein